MRPAAADYAHLPAVCGGDLDTCPNCGEDAGDAQRESFDSLTDVYEKSCSNCGLEWLLVYRFVGVSIKSIDETGSSLPNWTEYPVATDQRFMPEDAQATGV